MRRLALLSFALLAACAGGDPRLEPLSHAVITVGEDGVGLGELKLGATTLGEAFDRFGAERAHLVASDRVGLELELADGQLVLLFLYDENPRDDAEIGALRGATRDLAGFLAAQPERRDLRLASLAVAAGESRGATFFQGSLAQGVKLLDPLLESVASVGREPTDERPPMLAGASSDAPREKACFPELGLVLFGEREPRNDTPSRVTRIGLFLPDEP